MNLFYKSALDALKLNVFIDYRSIIFWFFLIFISSVWKAFDEGSSSLLVYRRVILKML